MNRPVVARIWDEDERPRWTDPRAVAAAAALCIVFAAFFALGHVFAGHSGSSQPTVAATRAGTSVPAAIPGRLLPVPELAASRPHASATRAPAPARSSTAAAAAQARGISAQTSAPVVGPPPSTPVPAGTSTPPAAAPAPAAPAAPAPAPESKTPTGSGGSESSSGGGSFDTSN